MMIEIWVPGSKLKSEVQRAIKAKVRAALNGGDDHAIEDLQALCDYQGKIMGWWA